MLENEYFFWCIHGADTFCNPYYGDFGANLVQKNTSEKSPLA
jgi:hypothetical protein